MANVLRKMKEGAVNFALQGDYRKDALKAIEEQEEIKMQKKARKLEAKEAKRAQREAEREEERKEFERRFKFSDIPEVIESEEDYTTFYGENNEQYSAVVIDSNFLLNEKMENFEKISGNALLKRNLKTSPLFIEDEKSFLKVLSVKEVVPEVDVRDKAYLLFDTKYNFFVIEFNVSRSF